MQIMWFSIHRTSQIYNESGGILQLRTNVRKMRSQIAEDEETNEKADPSDTVREKLLCSLWDGAFPPFD